MDAGYVTLFAMIALVLLAGAWGELKRWHPRNRAPRKEPKRK